MQIHAPAVEVDQCTKPLSPSRTAKVAMPPNGEPAPRTIPAVFPIAIFAQL